MINLAEAIPGGLIILVISGWVAVERKLKEKISTKEAEKKFVNRDVCVTLHKSIDEKLEMIPKINETVIRIDQRLKDKNE